MYRKTIVAIIPLVLMAGLFGCAAARYPYVSSVSEKNRRLTKEDVVNMVTSGVGDDVVISLIKATSSRFKLSVSDIVELKKAGVSERVIECMIRTDTEPVREWHPYWLCYYRCICDYPLYPYYYYPRIYLGVHVNRRYHSRCYHPRWWWEAA